MYRHSMKLVWAVLAAAAMVTLVVFLMIIIVHFARRRDPNTGMLKMEVVVALVALAVSVFFGIMAWPDEKGTPAQGAGRTPAPTTAPSTSSSPPTTDEPAPSETEEVEDAVKILKITNRGNRVDVTVQVDGPPSSGTEYLLVAQFRGQFQIKGKVPSGNGEHTVKADLHLADPGSWRDFFIVGVGPAAAKEWAASTEDPLFAVPKGSKELTDWKPHQMPR